jgi:drug/metabolite transporter (DMT)-like permease
MDPDAAVRLGLAVGRQRDRRHSLLFLLVRKGEAGKVASLFYLIPGVTALMAYAVLGETLTVMSLAGFVTTGGAVWLCTRSR